MDVIACIQDVCCVTDGYHTSGQVLLSRWRTQKITLINLLEVITEASWAWQDH